jgi:hypothetical protein
MKHMLHRYIVLVLIISGNCLAENLEPDLGDLGVAFLEIILI